MKRRMATWVIGTAALLSSGCTNGVDPPLIFGETNTIGVTISGSAPEQGGELTLGYRSRDIAIVPIIVREADGNVKIILPTIKQGNDSYQDAISVLGQFEATAAAASPQVGLGRFFATGQAAKTLADGFAGKLQNKPN